MSSAIDSARSHPASVDAYFELMADRVPSPGNLRFYLEYLFRDVELAGKRVLDVGASGAGRYALYAASRGAAEVVGLPELDAEGSTAGDTDELEQSARLLGLTTVRFLSGRPSEHGFEDGRFDVLLLYASINHLDEEACMRLPHDPAARDLYLALLGELARVAAPGATLIAVDCSPRNSSPASDGTRLRPRSSGTSTSRPRCGSPCSSRWASRARRCAGTRSTPCGRRAACCSETASLRTASRACSA